MPAQIIEREVKDEWADYGDGGGGDEWAGGDDWGAGATTADDGGYGGYGDY